jgi:hypothetical protein
VRPIVSVFGERDDKSRAAAFHADSSPFPHPLVRVLCVSRVFVFSSSFDVDDERSSSLFAKEEEAQDQF